MIISLATPRKISIANIENKISSVIHHSAELITMITMWAVVSTSVILLGLTWV